MKKIHDGERSTNLYVPEGYGITSYKIQNIQLDTIVDKIWGSKVPLKIKTTPHFKYLLGNKDPLRKYFLACRGFTWARRGTANENMTVDELLLEYEAVINSDKDYLQPPFQDHYIIVRSDLNCVDGLRRACVLLSNGIEEAPVAVV
tara:strand:- start:59 stop:496 length:438 start_codon:yes stop_codon:yes gene_type:complete